MLTLILQKILNKKWMVMCLLIGNILLVAVAVCYPMYRTSSFQSMLTDEFDAYKEKMDTWPAKIVLEHTRYKDEKAIDYETMQKYVEIINQKFNIPVIREVEFLNTSTAEASPIIEREEKITRYVRLAAVSDFEEHITLYVGRMPNPGLIEKEYLEVILLEDVAEDKNMLLDEVYELKDCTFADGSPLRIKVVGMFYKTNPEDSYWVRAASSMQNDLYLDWDTFQEFFTGEEAEPVYGLSKIYYELWDYEQIKPSEIAHILRTTSEITNNKTYGEILKSNVYEGIIESYSAKAKRVEATLLILQIPVLALLMAFIYMISSQMLSMEQSEISIMKSRGAKSSQIISMYFIQNLILGAVAAVLGLPLGRLFCEIMGATTNFMEFSGTRKLDVQYSADVAVYAVTAIAVNIIMTLLPVFRYSKVTIVNLKRSKANKKISLWKKLGLDIICILIGLYGYWSFTRNQDIMMEQVLTGEALDPVLYLCSSLFLFGCGLFALRLQPLLLKLLFAIFGKKLSPAPYVSFIDGIRGGKRQEFIMLFMALTVALGIYNMTVARTIVVNAEDNATYLNGADVVAREVWLDNSYTKTGDEAFEYIEPDYGRFTTIPGIDKTTKVLRKQVSVDGMKEAPTMLGINTSEFYEVAYMQNDLLPYEFHEYLNALASSEKAILASENFMTKLGYKLGDTIEVTDNGSGRIRFKIVGFFPYWPSYEAVTYSLNSDGSLQEAKEYMLVANLPTLQSEWLSYPYEVWMKVGENTDGLYEFAQKGNTIGFTQFNDLEVIKDDIRNDTLFQGTNGILTMSFIVVLVLCGVGYLIYFILAIRSRELLFGVLRAMGMRKGEITTMLLLEQIFCGLYAIVAGTVTGLIGSFLFVPMIQNAYAASDQVLPLELIVRGSDLLQLFAIIGIVMVVCLIVIVRIVARLNISKALKLGED